MTSNARARAKRRGTSAQARLLAGLFTTLPIFPRSREMRGRAHVWVWECSDVSSGMSGTFHRVGGNRAGALVIHDQDASWGDLALRHLERRWNGAIDKQPFATAQGQRIYLEPVRIDQIMLHQRLKEISAAVNV